MSDLIKKNYRNLINGQDLDKLIAPGHATISELLQGKVAAQVEFLKFKFLFYQKKWNYCNLVFLDVFKTA